MSYLDTAHKLWLQRAVVDELKAALALEEKKLTGLKLDFVKEIDAVGLTKQHIPGRGTLSIQTKFSVKVPKGDEAKASLFQYIEKEKGPPVLFGLQTIHSATLNSFYDQEFELAKERGDHRWVLPGVGEPEAYKQISFRKE